MLRFLLLGAVVIVVGCEAGRPDRAAESDDEGTGAIGGGGGALGGGGAGGEDAGGAGPEGPSLCESFCAARDGAMCAAAPPDCHGECERLRAMAPWCQGAVDNLLGCSAKAGFECNEEDAPETAGGACSAASDAMLGCFRDGAISSGELATICQGWCTNNIDALSMNELPCEGSPGQTDVGQCIGFCLSNSWADWCPSSWGMVTLCESQLDPATVEGCWGGGWYSRNDQCAFQRSFLEECRP